MGILRLLGIGLATASLLAAQPAFAASDEYDDSQSHPLRVGAYALYPLGFIAEWMVFRPLHFIVSATEPQEAFFGHRPHPPVLGSPQPLHDYGLPKKVPAQQMTRVAPKAPEPIPLPEHVKIVETPVEKIVVKDRVVEKIVEVEKIIFPPVAFNFDSASLTDLGKGQVYLAAQRLKEKADLTIVIEGHADNRGSDEYNQKLGLQRAQTVVKELTALGIDPGRLSTGSVGESKPLIEQDTSWARAVNRRVEFQVKAAAR
jgi:peptidoglycan-associated lipoprotein